MTGVTSIVGREVEMKDGSRARVVEQIGARAWIEGEVCPWQVYGDGVLIECSSGPAVYRRRARLV